MMARDRRRTLLALVAALALLAAACGGGGEEDVAEAPAGGDEAAAPGGGGEDLTVDGVLIADAQTHQAALEEEPIVAYLAYAEEAMNAILEVYTEDTGLEVDFLQQPTGRMMERILTEKGADALTADVITVPEDANLVQLVDAGVFRAHEIPNHDEYEEQYVQEDRLYYEMAIGTSTLAFNNALVEETEGPRTYGDLLDPQWAGGLIGVVPINQGSTGYTFWRLMMEDYGEEYWEEMAAQEPVLQPGTGPLHDELVRGEYPIAIGRPPIIGTQIDDGAPLTMVWPEGERTPAWTWGLGVVDGAANENAAEVFVNWMLSVRGQSTIAQVSGDFPTHPDAPPPAVQGEPLPVPDFYFHDDTPEEVQANMARWEEIFGFTG
jgi:iron(III) transport system substrate-binding protein